MKLTLNERQQDIIEFFKDAPRPVYFVGGCVRDLVMGNTPCDYDLFTAMRPEQTEAYIHSKGRRALKIGARFGTIAVKLTELVEVTTYRKETYDLVSRKPNVIFTDNLDEDLNRRDFTMNALYQDFKGKVHDHVGGLEDIEASILRAIGNPTHRFKEDPLRILRGIRFANRFGLCYDDKTKEKMNHVRWELLRLSKERIREELEKAYKTSPNIETYLADMFNMEMFQVICPPLHLQLGYDQNTPHHQFPLNVHTRKVISLIKKSGLDTKHFWTGLLHDIAKPFTKSINKKGTANYINHDVLGAEMAEQFCLAYKFSNEERKFIVTSIREHLNPDCWLREFDANDYARLQ